MSVFEHPAWGAIQTLFTLVAVIVTIIIFLKQRRKKEISYEIASDMPLFLIGDEEEKGNLEIQYEGKDIEQAYVGTIQIFNSGNMPIEVDDFASPISVYSSKAGQILTAKIVDREPDDLDVSIDIKDGEVVLNPTLFNRGDALTLRIICTEPCAEMVAKGRIKGVKKIKKFIGAERRYLGLAVVGVAVLLSGFTLPVDFFIPPILFITSGGIIGLYSLSKIPTEKA